MQKKPKDPSHAKPLLCKLRQARAFASAFAFAFAFAFASALQVFLLEAVVRFLQPQIEHQHC